MQKTKKKKKELHNLHRQITSTPHINLSDSDLYLTLGSTHQLNTLVYFANITTSPNKILRSFPPLDAKEIIALTVLIVRKIPEPLFAELIDHAK